MSARAMVTRHLCGDRLFLKFTRINISEKFRISENLLYLMYEKQRSHYSLKKICIMKQYLLKLSGLVAIVMLMNAAVWAQDEKPQADSPKIVRDRIERIYDNDQIVIERKGNKDVKLTIEVKGDQVFVNGKPVSEFENADIKVKKMKSFFNDDNMAMVAPVSPFRGGWSYSGDGNMTINSNSRTAFLGVNWDNTDNGAKVTAVTKASAAEKAGLKEGDIITKIGDSKVDDGDLADVIHNYKPEDKVTITYLRDGKEQKTTATLGRSRNVAFTTYNGMKMPKMNQYFNNENGFNYYYGKPKLGIKAQDLEEGKGAKVLDVDDESPADKAGIKEGDIINEFEGKPVDSADDLAKLARENKEKYTYTIKLTRDGKPQEVVVKIPRKLKTADL
jgi:serine protease Do